jgi:hypothetical protein
MPLRIEVNKVNFESVAKKGGKPSSTPVWLDRASEELGQTSTVRSVTNTARRGLQITNYTSAANANTRLAVTHLETFSDIIQLMNILPSIRTIVTESKRKTFSRDPVEAAYEKRIRNLTIASSVLGIGVGTLVPLKMVNRFGALKFSEIAQSMGNFPVSSGGFAAFPFSSFFSVLELAEASVQIALAAENIKHLNKKVSKAKGKIHTWSGPLTSEWITKRITHLKSDKLKDIEETAKEQASQAEKLAEKVKVVGMKAAKLRKEIAKSESKNPLKKLAIFHKKLQLKRLEKKQVRLIKRQHAECEGVEKNIAAYAKVEKKVEHWGKIQQAIDSGELTEPITNQLQKFQNQKMEKWKVKKENMRIEKTKHGLVISHRTIVIISLIASIILAATGVGIIPLLITTASLSLFLALYGLGINLYKKYKKGKPVEGVQMPQLA